MRRFVIKLSSILMLALVIASGSALFWVSQKVQQLEREQRSIKQQVVSEKEGIRVLSAEWDYLNRPDRLEALASRYLNSMKPVEPENLLKNANALPEKIEDMEGSVAVIPVAYPVVKPQSSTIYRSSKAMDIPASSIKDNTQSSSSFQDVLKQIEQGGDE